MNAGLDSKGAKALRTNSQRAGDDVRRWSRFWSERDGFILSCAEATRLWLHTNKESFTAEGNRQPKPWWPAPVVGLEAVVEEKDEKERERKLGVFLRLLQERDVLVRERCFEHGLSDLLQRLNNDPQLDDGKWHNKVTRIATNAEVSAILRELYRLRSAATIIGGVDNISLNAVAALMKYSPRVGTDKVYRRIVGLAEWGLVDAQRTQKAGILWAISIGPVGWSFIETVFYPTIDEIRAEIDDLRKDVKKWQK